MRRTHTKIVFMCYWRRTLVFNEYHVRGILFPSYHDCCPFLLCLSHIGVVFFYIILCITQLNHESMLLINFYGILVIHVKSQNRIYSYFIIELWSMPNSSDEERYIAISIFMMDVYVFTLLIDVRSYAWGFLVYIIHTKLILIW